MPLLPIRPLAGILFDRDGTLVVDVPFNADPRRVEPLPTAAEAVQAARDAGLRVGVATNQPGLSTGQLAAGDLAAVHERIDALLGPFDSWQFCPHAKDAGCGCRKPQPGLILAAAREWDVPPAELALIGDTAADLGAAEAAGARAVLVPNPVTRPEEVETAPAVARTLLEAVELLLAARPAEVPA